MTDKELQLLVRFVEIVSKPPPEEKEPDKVTLHSFCRNSPQ